MQFGGGVLSLGDIFIAIWKGYPIAENSWYVINILVFYVVFWVLMKICKKHYAAMVIGACVYYVLWVLLCRKLSYGSWWYNSTQLLIVGMFWALEEEKILRIMKKYYFLIAPIVWTAFLGVFGISIFWNAADTPLFSAIRLLIFMTAAVLFVLSVNLFTMKFRVGNRVLNYLGQISFEIYLIHGLLILMLRSQYINIENQFLWSCAVILCTIVSAHVLHWLFQFILSKYKALLQKII